MANDKETAVPDQNGTASPKPSGLNMNEMTPTTISAVSVVFLSNNTDPVVDDRLIKVKIKYPKDYKGVKAMTDGDVKEVSPETADMFINDLKIATQC